MAPRAAGPFRRAPYDATMGSESLVGTTPSLRSTLLTVLAWVTVIAAPLLPGMLGSASASAARLPVETILLLLLSLVLPHPALRLVVASAFAMVTVVTIATAVLDRSFVATIDRGFALAEDWRAVANAYRVVDGVVGPTLAALAATFAVAIVIALVVVLVWCALRCARTLRDAGNQGRTAVTAAAVAWSLFAVAGVQYPTGTAVAAADSLRSLSTTVEYAAQSARERDAFAAGLRVDPLAEQASEQLLGSLQGKDVVIAFVESFGEVALSGTGPMSSISRTIDEYAARLSRDGYRAESAFLSSPTFGGVSWLAHSTLQSGMWVDSQQKYDTLVESDRLTISRLFHDAGWRTIVVSPAVTEPWPEGAALYGFDRILDKSALAYEGPAFGFASVPDQFTWHRFAEEELSRPAPIMAQLSLISSHSPWTPTPQLVPWAHVGKPGPFSAQPRDSSDVWPDAQRVRAAYAESIRYSLRSTLSFLETYDPSNLVLVLVGDHQPSRIVSGETADTDVPITIVSKDSAVFEHIEEWGWDPGFRPSSDAPVWRMDAFRDRFVAAFSGPE